MRNAHAFGRALCNLTPKMADDHGQTVVACDVTAKGPIPTFEQHQRMVQQQIMMVGGDECMIPFKMVGLLCQTIVNNSIQFYLFRYNATYFYDNPHGPIS